MFIIIIVVVVVIMIIAISIIIIGTFDQVGSRGAVAGKEIGSLEARWTTCL